MRFSCSPNRIFAFLAILIAATALHAQDGWRDAALRLQSSHSRIGGPFGPSLVAADFNHDDHTDGAVLLRDGSSIQIEVHLRSHLIRRLSFKSNLANLAISARDVNQDGSLDLIIENPFRHRPLFVWLNDGSGKFYAGSITDYPPARDGNYNEVTGPLPTREYSALIKSNGVRIRLIAGRPDQQISVPSLIGFMGRAAQITDLAHISPNLVRGSPVLHSLWISCRHVRWA
jgi:hypothetical protein